MRVTNPDDILVDEDQDDDDRPGRDVIVIFAVFFEGGLAPLSLLLGWWLGHHPLAHFNWSWQAPAFGALVTVPLIMLFLLMLLWPIGPLRKIKDFCDDEFVPLLAGSTWSDIALIALSAGVGEEMLFRGVLQSSLDGWLGVAWGLGLSSLLFGLLHPISLPYMVVSMLLGYYLGLVYVYSGNLLTVLVTHALYDFALMAYLLKIRVPRRPGIDPIQAIGSDERIDDLDCPG